MPCCCIDCARSLSPSSQSFERAALRLNGTVRVAFSELALGIAHGFPGPAELIHLALPLLALPEPALAQLFHQFLELIAQRLLILAKLPHLAAALAFLALLSALSAQPVTTLVLTLLESTVAQLLLLADHVAKLVQRRHHVVVAVAIHLLSRTGHLQIFEHGLELLQHPARGILGAGAR